MNILILTQYFPPETGAPQNRLLSLANNLDRLGAHVHVLTAMPNYPKMVIDEAYKNKFYLKEHIGNIVVYRSWIFVRKTKKIFPRLLNYFSFVLSSLWVGIFKTQKYDIIICESPPLFLGITAILLKKIKNAKLVFNVSDLWPESAVKLNLVRNESLIKLSYKLEKSIYAQSNLVSGQTQGIIKDISSRYPKVKTYWFKNGIDVSAFNLNATPDGFKVKHQIDSKDFMLLYAGVLGHAQGLEVIIEAAQNLKAYKNIKLFLVGDGPEKNKLEQLKVSRDTSNVYFISNVSRDQMPEIVAACNAYIVPLKKFDLFKGAIPSKIFEPLAMAKPIILGVDGEARGIFIEQGKAGLYYEPENAAELTACILQLYENPEICKTLGESGKSFVLNHFNRDTIAGEFYKQLKEIL